MVNPRIYRAFLVIAALAVIVFGFSFQSQPGGASTALAPGQFFGSSYATMKTLAREYPNRAPGSSGDQALAQHVRQKLQKTGGFTVSTNDFSARTAAGEQPLTDVIATRTGLENSTIVIVSDRDASGSPATSSLSGTSLMLGLAQALSGETLNRSVTLISTSGSVGSAGATALAHDLAGRPVDAVISLGDLAAATVRRPVVVPWSSGDTLAPPMLRNTLSHYLGQQLRGMETTAFGGQIAQLAFPLSLTDQAPFEDLGIPAVSVSLSGERLPAAGERLGPPARTAALGGALLQSINALEHAPTVTAPRSYLTISGKYVPFWAVRLLVLALILPVAGATLDALARTRRRGHSVARWIGWVLAGAVPFVIGVLLLLIAGAAGLLSATPPGAVGAGGVSVTGGDIAVLGVILALIVGSFFFLRPFCLRMLSGLQGSGRRPDGAPADAAGVALSIVMCVLALVVWAFNPFAAALLVPALHLWVWLAQPEARARRAGVFILTLLALVPPVLVVVYYSQSLGLSPGDMLWTGTLMVAGGAMPVASALYWSVALGCLASALVLMARAMRATTAQVAQEPVVTVRGPTSYAGPGSLGGTESALRR